MYSSLAKLRAESSKRSTLHNVLQLKKQTFFHQEKKNMYH